MVFLLPIALIMGLSFLGEALSALIPLPVPGSIYGLVMMLALLLSGVVKLEKVRATGDFLISLMPLMFIAPSVGLMADFSSYRSILAPFAVICLASTLIVMAVTGLVSQSVLRHSKKARPDAAKGDTL